jgi:putative peptidoglycan lipid II flippase
MVLFLTVPSTVGLAILGVPIIRLIFQHGRFSAHATLETAHALSGYAVGLVSYAAIKVVAQAFYALKRAKVPMLASLLAVAANLIWNITTVRALGHVGLALGTSLAATVNLAVLLVAFQRRSPGFLSRELGSALLRIGAASALMGGAVWLLRRFLEPALGDGLVPWALEALVPVGVGAIVYFAAARAFGVEEARTLVRRFRR